jgi:drug/metabolite transporter (DMT)-like permease
MAARAAASAADETATPLWIRAAPALFVAFWASGFPILKLGVEYAEPFTLLSIRGAVNVLLVAATVPFVRVRWPRGWREAGHIAVSGFLLQAAYLGAMFFALSQGVAQGVAALVAGMQPLLTAALAGALLGERVRAWQWLGFVLGFGGLALVVSDRLDVGTGTGTAIGFAAVALTPFLITAGSLYQKRFCADMDLRAGMLIQHTIGAIACYAMACAIETREVDWTWELVFVIAWLVLLLSVAAQNLYFVMLRRGEAARVSSLFYLTPPSAAVLGYLTYGETFGWLAVVGFAVAVAGVVLVTRRDGIAR